jgi:hypothetical protein
VLLNMTHSLSMKAVNDAEYHIIYIKILFQKCKIKIILISVSLLSGVGLLREECVEERKFVCAQLFF